MCEESSSIVDLFINLTFVPISLSIRKISVTSDILGTFSIRQTPCDKIVAGIIATAAFLAPLTDIFPINLFPPVKMYLSIQYIPSIYNT